MPSLPLLARGNVIEQNMIPMIQSRPQVPRGKRIGRKIKAPMENLIQAHQVQLRLYLQRQRRCSFRLFMDLLAL
jgi:hypothetical protein